MSRHLRLPMQLAIIAVVATACSRGQADDTPTANDAIVEPVPVRVVVRPNPAPGDLEATVEFRTVPADDALPRIVHEHRMAVSKADAKVDVHGAEALDVLVNGEEALTIPRHFWEGMSRGWMIVRVQPGGVELIRSVEPTGNGRTCVGNAKGETCWSTEKWYFPGPLWGSGKTAAVPVVVVVKPHDEVGDIPVRIHADDPTGPVLAETSTAEMGGPSWQTTVDLDQDASLVVVAGDRSVELTPDFWQLTWTSIRVELTENGATFVYHWPTSSRRLEKLREPLAVDFVSGGPSD